MHRPSVPSLRRTLFTILCLLALPLVAGVVAPRRLAAQAVAPSMYGGMRWRLIGPFRAGRALAATGVPGQPDVFYFGAVDGGVWKTDNAGLTWTPIFDAEPVGSIGAIAVAPSNPDIIYVGTGEADMRSDISYGDGMYKSTDAGRTWTHIGLTDTRQIGCVLVDPRNPNVVFVAALGHAYGPNAERGVFRSTDGGATWQKVLYKDANTGAIDLAFDPQNPQTIYAALWQTRRPPWNVYPPSNGPGSGLYKSTDGGTTWHQLAGHGLPSEGLGRMGIAIPPTQPNRIYLIVDAKAGGLYRSDDGGQSWTLVDNDSRIWGRGWYFCGVTADPKNPDTVYVANTSLYRSTDGGHDFTAIKGAPGGDDYHLLWIEPNDPTRMILASDQGVVVSVDDAKTWSSWYNQPTAQFYHVSTDNRFPFWVYGAQQDSGAMAVPSQSKYARISGHDWHPISVGGENGYVVPDPLNPDILYGGTVTRYDQRTGADQDIAPTLGRRGSFRVTWTLPLAFSPADPHALYFGHQMIFRTLNGGRSWQEISPDLTRKDPGVPPNLDPTTAADANGRNPRRGVVYAIAPSPLNAAEIWAGTDDGLIDLTRDGGKTWQNVTPPALTAWSKVGIIEASPFDANTAYAAVDRHRLEDYKPYIYRTRDGGKTWQNVVSGIPDGAYVNAVREDPVRKGLLYAGTETGIYVSFDDGDHWQSLQLNLPHTSIRDMAIRDNDLVVATHGRSFWILDDVTPLRQITAQVAASSAYLFQPEPAIRVQTPSDEGTPYPFETPTGENPPQGAIIDYYLGSAPQGPVTLDIRDHTGALVRRYASNEHPPAVNPRMLNIPMYWVKPTPVLSAEPGMHRWIWDLHEAAPPSLGGRPTGYYTPTGAWVTPGTYTVTLTVAGHRYTRSLTVSMDPRVKTPAAALADQFQAARQANTGMADAARAFQGAVQLRARLGAAGGAHAAELRELDALIGAPPSDNPPSAVGGPVTNLREVYAQLGQIARAVESAPAAPTMEATRALSSTRATLTRLLTRWKAIQQGSGAR